MTKDEGAEGDGDKAVVQEATDGTTPVAADTDRSDRQEQDRGELK